MSNLFVCFNLDNQSLQLMEIKTAASQNLLEFQNKEFIIHKCRQNKTKNKTRARFPEHLISLSG